ncbi:uncharacterized protein METZ01_LOCUS432972, partial [marine metagenome]
MWLIKRLQGTVALLLTKVATSIVRAAAPPP